ncbi:MAG: hypothetical protein ACE5JU_19565 [Candidatus Binatia bacterium]
MWQLVYPIFWGVAYGADRKDSPELIAWLILDVTSPVTYSSQIPDPRSQSVKFVDELVDLAVGGFDLALKAGFSALGSLRLI